MQKLKMPFQRQMMLCGYKNPNYTKAWGYAHYGVDLSSAYAGTGADRRIYASGEGICVDCGWDNSGGNIVIVLYPEVYIHATGETKSLVARYMHLSSIAVTKGEKVVAGSVLGVEGNTKTTDFHLHLEFDTDTDPRYYAYSPQVSNRDDAASREQGNLLKKGRDSSVNPSYVLHVSKEQEIVPPTYNPAWLNKEDFMIPALGEELDWQARYFALYNELKELMKRFDPE